MISFRIPPEMEQKLNSIALAEGKSRSEIVKESIAEYIAHREERINPFQLGEDLFGAASSEKGDLSTNRKKYLGQKLEQKHENRNRSH